jgi:PAS domain S-box-containing protein
MSGSLPVRPVSPEDGRGGTGFRRFWPQGLRLKLAAGVILILIIAMGLIFALQYRWFYHELISRLGLSSTPLSDVIKGSLMHAMQTRNLSEVSAIIDNVSRQPGVIKVFVVDKQGVIRFSPVREEIGVRVPLADPTCQICHHVQVESRNKTVIFTVAGGQRVFRNVNPILNEPACFGCHDPKDRLNGVLISDFSMAEIDRRLASTFRGMLLGLLLAVGATGLTITLTMNRLIIRKLEQVVRATKLLGRGQLDLKVDVASRDEIGELATSFNEMVEGLRRAQTLRERKELLENVLNNVDDCVMVFAPDGTVLALNRGTARVFGLDVAAVIGRRYPFFGEEQEAVLARARSAGPLTIEMKLRAEDGRYFPAQIHLAALRSEADDLQACVAVAQDLTQEKVKARLQQQLAHSEKLAAVGRLAAGVAHELNNPLGNVLLYAKLLLEDTTAAGRAHGNARQIVENTLRCKAIVRSLLDYARQSEVQLAWTDLNEVIETSVQSVASDLRLRGLACALHLDPALPRLRCDRRQMQQVLVNLLQNGIEAIEGQGGLTVFSRRSESGDAVVVGVRDDGRGLAPEARSRMFEPFYTTKEQGTGLGLSICYGIVARHNGRIWAESGGSGGAAGSTFFVELPLQGEGPA